MCSTRLLKSLWTGETSGLFTKGHCEAWYMGTEGRYRFLHTRVTWKNRKIPTCLSYGGWICGLESSQLMPNVNPWQREPLLWLLMALKLLRKQNLFQADCSMWKLNFIVQTVGEWTPGQNAFLITLVNSHQKDFRLSVCSMTKSTPTFKTLTNK